MKAINLSVQIASHTVLSQHHNRFAVLIQRLSVLGMTIGIAVLIVISSIFNGFRGEITKSLNQVKPHIMITHVDTWWYDWPEVLDQLNKDSAIKSTQARIRTYGVIAGRQQAPPVQLIAEVQPHDATVKTKNKTKQSQFTVKKPIDSVISTDLSYELWLEDGDTFGLITLDPFSEGDVQPLALRMTYRGKQPANQNGGEQRAIKTTWGALKSHLPVTKPPITEITIEADHVMAAEQLANKLRNTLPNNLEVRNVSSQFSALLGSLQMQQRMMGIVLSLVVVVAACNLVTSLVMMVTERKKEIALMRSVGMKKGTLLGIFMLQGLMLSIAALLLGTLCGVFIAWHITGWVDSVERFFDIKLISDQVFMLNYLPSTVQITDIVWVWLGTLLLALISALYPARLACAVEPAEVLRYE